MGDAGATGLPARLELLKSRGINDNVNDSLALSSAAALANLQAPDECTLVRTLPLHCTGVGCRFSNQAAAAQAKPGRGARKPGRLFTDSTDMTYIRWDRWARRRR